MNNSHRKTLERVFAQPIASNIKFSEIESLLVAVGATRIEGSGSRLKFKLGSAVLLCHRPHPRPEAKPYQVKDVRRFMEEIGITPETIEQKEQKSK